MNLQVPEGSYRILENPVGSHVGFLPGYTYTVVYMNDKLIFFNYLVNPLSPDIKMHILITDLYTFLM